MNWNDVPVSEFCILFSYRSTLKNHPISPLPGDEGTGCAPQ
jgi:hypothetical protein